MSILRYRLPCLIPDNADAFQLFLKLLKLLSIDRNFIDSLRIGKVLLLNRSSELLNCLLKFTYGSINVIDPYADYRTNRISRCHI